MSMRENFEDIVYDFIHRDGISNFMTWLATDTDFYKAPASTKYHGNYEGGLVDHSLAVCYEIFNIAYLYGHEYLSTSSGNESLALVSLFHDVCKHNMYIPSVKNVKNQETGKWETQNIFIVNPDQPVFYAHGAYSVFLLTQFMTLSREESMAIYHHMGMYDSGNYDNPGRAYENSRLAWLLHAADEVATYIRKK